MMTDLVSANTVMVELAWIITIVTRLVRTVAIVVNFAWANAIAVELVLAVTTMVRLADTVVNGLIGVNAIGIDLIWNSMVVVHLSKDCRSTRSLVSNTQRSRNGDISMQTKTLLCRISY
ncbi:hypothetical protein F4861DRAFT_518034 [Xylaria intraflava]|nr:hypothetical protein F4861DRAFT_518034 [Xylaria intraflava]